LAVELVQHNEILLVEPYALSNRLEGLISELQRQKPSLGKAPLLKSRNADGRFTTLNSDLALLHALVNGESISIANESIGGKHRSLF
jgi:hypothetical protein